MKYKPIVTNEMVYYSASNEKKINFSGTADCLTPDERLSFLKSYADAACIWHGDAGLCTKAADPESVSEVLAGISYARDLSFTRHRKTLRFNTMTAHEVKKAEPFDGLHLYCGAYLAGDELIFPSRDIRPTPCALAELEPKEKTTVSFEVWLPESYRVSQKQKCGDNNPGRVIELRCRTLDKVKLKIFNTGEVFAFQGNMWQPEEYFIGQFRFDEWNSFCIEVGDTASVTLNGHTVASLPLTAQGKIDALFFDGCMFPRGEWRVRSILSDGAALSFDSGEQTETLPEGTEVELPYAIGGYAKRDTRLYLTKTFEADDFDKAILNISTLDPCGKAWINGNLVVDTTTFTYNKTDISRYLRKGTNKLTILVEPRAPEVYYFWHRHTDCCNGWFCGEVSIDFTSQLFISSIKVKTDSVSPKVSGRAYVQTNAPADGTVILYASECYPQKGEEFVVAKADAKGQETVLSFDGDFKLWSPDSPTLYCIRAELVDKCGSVVDDFGTETGFRTIAQQDGGIYLNGERILLNGALLMQFLPPFDDVPVNHNCPSAAQLAEQALMLKGMNGNFLRLHMLGYGTNDPRYARVCDRMGIMLVWTTRFIDSLEELVWDDGIWREGEEYCRQITEVINHPSIIMYEGSNEYRVKDRAVLDRMYDLFTDSVKSVDSTRLLTPCSHLYYGGGIYDGNKCLYYNDDGTLGQDGEPSSSSYGWRDELVIRSAHTYSQLCGYGSSWERMRKQSWQWQHEMLESSKHSYLITEFATTALANPHTPEALANDYVESYERDDELGVIGRRFEQSEWKESQAYQALCAFNAVKLMRLSGVDGMTWCCLSSGANNGSYLKPPIDFYGYKKLGFYALSQIFAPICACSESIDVSYAGGDAITPVILRTSQCGKYSLKVKVTDQNNCLIDEKHYEQIELAGDGSLSLEPFVPSWHKPGHYSLCFELCRL